MVDMTNDVIRFEKLFADRFTEKDPKFMEIKSNNIPEPPVVYPWKIMRKQWVKRWDYGNRRSHDHRNQRERGGRQSHSSNRYRDFDGEVSRERYRDRSQDGRAEKHRESNTFDFQAALKAYQERF